MKRCIYCRTKQTEDHEDYCPDCASIADFEAVPATYQGGSNGAVAVEKAARQMCRCGKTAIDGDQCLQCARKAKDAAMEYAEVEEVEPEEHDEEEQEHEEPTMVASKEIAKCCDRGKPVYNKTTQECINCYQRRQRLKKKGIDSTAAPKTVTPNARKAKAAEPDAMTFLKQRAREERDEAIARVEAEYKENLNVARLSREAAE